VADTRPTAHTAALPARARIVIIGGGVGGASVAHHLAERGERDVLLVERAELTSGSTFHSAGLVGQLRADPALTRMNAWSAALYRRLEEAGGDGRRAGWSPGRCGWRRARCGWRRSAQAAWARRAGLPLELVSAKEAADLFPLMSTDGVLGAAYTPTDGQVDPARLCYALAASAGQVG
jgi:4-methylaminobutanoate oxidase (formaldehyde-forming)